jgi:glycosyltransferase involved in cell wall biosynthesis
MSGWLGEAIPPAPALTDWSPVPSAAESTRLTIAFLGEGRATKGFLDLPDIADHVAAVPDLATAVRLVVQDWPPFRADREAHAAAVARLRRHPFVTIVGGILTPEAYDEQLAAAQVLLLPYDPRSYSLQGSGILVEGFARGAVIVARAGTSMADSTENGVVFDFHQPADLIDTLRRLVRNRDDILAEAAGRASRFRRLSTPHHYVAALDSRSRDRRLD